MSEQIWYKDPSVLFSPDTWYKFVPTSKMTVAESLNSVVRFTVYFSIILYLATTATQYIVAVPIVMAFTVVLSQLFPHQKTLETFKLKGKVFGSDNTMPTQSNPFMNPLLTEIQDSPNRLPAAPVDRQDVKADMYKTFNKTTDLYMDTSDLFDQTQGMRTFNAVPVTTIPGDLDGFKKFLSKGSDQPDYSSTNPARNAKIASESHIISKGSLPALPSTTSHPSGTSPSTSK